MDDLLVDRMRREPARRVRERHETGDTPSSTSGHSQVRVEKTHFVTDSVL